VRSQIDRRMDRVVRLQGGIQIQRQVKQRGGEGFDLQPEQMRVPLELCPREEHDSYQIHVGIAVILCINNRL